MNSQCVEISQISIKFPRNRYHIRHISYSQKASIVPTEHKVPKRVPTNNIIPILFRHVLIVTSCPTLCHTRAPNQIIISSDNPYQKTIVLRDISNLWDTSISTKRTPSHRHGAKTASHGIRRRSCTHCSRKCGSGITPSYVAKATRVVRTHNEKTVVAATKPDRLRIWSGKRNEIEGKQMNYFTRENKEEIKENESTFWN